MTRHTSTVRTAADGAARRVVRARVMFELLPTGTPDPAVGPVPVRAHLRWTRTDPHVVELGFPVGSGTLVRWGLGRELLTDGIDRAPVGVGDVSVLPDLHHSGRRELVLSTPGGHACLRFQAADLAAFLTRTRGGEDD